MPVKITIDKSAFDKAFKEYLKYNKRALADIVNTKAYFIARNAVVATSAVSKDKIAEELLGASTKYPNAPLAGVLVNAQRAATGKSARGRAGLNGQRMRAAIEKLVRQRQATRNFLRSGWLPAIKKLAPFVTNKAGQVTLPSGVKSKSDKGGATNAPRGGNDNFKSTASVWNEIFGGKSAKSNTTKVHQLLQQGLQKAINTEVRSMQRYVEEKISKGAAIFNR